MPCHVAADATGRLTCMQALPARQDLLAGHRRVNTGGDSAGEGIDRWDEAALADDNADEDLAPGHGLKDLAAHHLGPDADAARRRLWAAHRLPDGHSAAFTQAWAAIPDDDPLLLDYAASRIGRDSSSVPRSTRPSSWRASTRSSSP